MYFRLGSANLSLLKIIFLGIVFPKGMKHVVCVAYFKNIFYYLKTTFCSDFL